MNLKQEHSQPFCIREDHPCLPGHFPGQPLVPAVVMLDQLADVLRTWRNVRMVRVVSARFSAPLLPGQQAILHLHAEADDCRFRIQCGDAEVARGRVETAA